MGPRELSKGSEVNSDESGAADDCHNGVDTRVAGWLGGTGVWGRQDEMRLDKVKWDEERSVELAGVGLIRPT